MSKINHINEAGGFAYIASCPNEFRLDLSSLDPATTQLTVFENDRELGPYTVMHSEIRDVGKGRFCVWEDSIYFSSSDGSDPRINGMVYSIKFSEPKALRTSIDSLKKDITVEKQGLAVETLRNVIRCGGLELLNELQQNIKLKGKKILEVGSGICWAAPFFIGAGAESYTGVDIGSFGDENVIFNREYASQLWTTEHYVTMPLTLDDYLGCFNNVQFCEVDFTKTDFEDEQFDVIFLRVVSEHLLKFRASIKEISRILKPGGKIYISHGSYHSWNGHHVTPHTIDEIDTNRPDILSVADWGHLETLIDNERGDHHYLNYLRIHELFDILSNYYVIDKWWVHKSDTQHGGGRLSHDKRKQLPNYYIEEMEVEMVYIVATKSNEINSYINKNYTENKIKKEKDFISAYFSERNNMVASWLHDGGDLLGLSRASGISVADLVEVKELFKDFELS